MRRILLLAVGSLAIGGCAARSGDSGGGWYTLAEVDETPVLNSCALYEPPPPSISRDRVVRVEVSFDVDASGSVVSPVARLQTTRLGAGGATSLATRVAQSCHYQPATLDGVPVGVRGLRRSFAFGMEE